MKTILTILTMVIALNSNAGWFSDDKPSAAQEAAWALEDDRQAALWESLTDKGKCKSEVKMGNAYYMTHYSRAARSVTGLRSPTKLEMFKACMKSKKAQNIQQDDFQTYYNTL